MTLIQHWSQDIELGKEKCINMGDQLVIPLSGFGEFTATAQTCTDEGTIFLFDDCIVEREMNKEKTNRGGFEASDICTWMRNVLLFSFPEELCSRIKNLALPTYGQIFGHDDWYERVVESDEDEQFPFMAKRENRIADFNNEWQWYWLKNATKKNVSAASFACVDYDGDAYYSHASRSRVGVRPVFLLVK